MVSSSNLDDLYRPRAFCERWPNVVTERALRWQLHRAAENGLEQFGAVLKAGRAVYIDAAKYRAWLERHAPAAELPE